MEEISTECLLLECTLIFCWRGVCGTPEMLWLSSRNYMMKLALCSIYFGVQSPGKRALRFGMQLVLTIMYALRDRSGNFE